MKAVSVSELKAHLAKYLRDVQRGREIQILHRGRPVARLCRVDVDADRGALRSRLISAGVVRPGRTSTKRLLETNEPIELQGLELSAALQDERGDRV